MKVIETMLLCAILVAFYLWLVQLDAHTNKLAQECLNLRYSIEVLSERGK